MSGQHLIYAITLILLSTSTMRAHAQQAKFTQRPEATQRQPISQDDLNTVDSSSLDWESANARRMFIIANGGSAISAISVDTTHIEDPHAALKLQELVFRMSTTRLPIVDKRFVTIPWGKIHIVWDHFPARPRKRSYSISMQESDPTSANPPKQIIIGGTAGGVDRAVSAFTEATLGIPLAALQDESYRWERRKIVAIPENLKTIYGSTPEK